MNAGPEKCLRSKQHSVLGELSIIKSFSASIDKFRKAWATFIYVHIMDKRYMNGIWLKVTDLFTINDEESGKFPDFLHFSCL